MSGRITLVGLMGATSNIALGNTPDTNPLLLRASLNISALARKMSAGVLLHVTGGVGPVGSGKVVDPEPVPGTLGVAGGGPLGFPIFTTVPVPSKFKDTGGGLAGFGSGTERAGGGPTD